MTPTDDRARALNRTASFLPPEPGDDDAIPVVILGPLRIGAYFSDDGCLLILCDAEEATDWGDRLPVVVHVNRPHGTAEAVISI
ncbi:hypothetical protein ABZV92_19925 [Streptomyces rubiginosohelvolus]|uniref:hypothetical protein n=1 Tax=Streptomyces rubiginosohelvolus TaxID=67362 RepID=UPI0033A4C933